MREGVRKPHGDRGSDRQDRPPLRHRGVRPAELHDQCGPESSDRQAVRPAKLIDADQVVRGYVGEVVISCGSEVIARHPRSYRRDDFVFDPVHYLPLLERKTGALDQAAPLAGWKLPEDFGRLRRLLESRMGGRGKREFVQVSRLMENFRKEEVYEGVRDALRLGAISFDAVKHLVLCGLEGRPPRLDLELYPYLPRVTVARTSAGGVVVCEGLALACRRSEPVVGGNGVRPGAFRERHAGSLRIADRARDRGRTRSPGASVRRQQARTAREAPPRSGGDCRTARTARL